jgi:hypothetical protein
MTIDPQDESMPQTDAPLDVLLRRSDRGAPRPDTSALEARILAQAAFPLAARQRRARVSMADTLAAWVRVALPLAAAAALFAALSLSRMDVNVVVDVELRDSDPGVLLSALESESSSGLVYHVIANDSDAASPDLTESR